MLFKAAGCDLIDCSSGQVSAAAEADLRAHVPDAVRRPHPQRVGIATMAVGAISEADHVNSIISPAAPTCARWRVPHLANLAWTLIGRALHQLPSACRPGTGAVPSATRSSNATSNAKAQWRQELAANRRLAAGKPANLRR